MKQTFKFLTSDTMSRLSRECRDTLGRLSTSLLLLFALSFGFNQEVKAWEFNWPNVYFYTSSSDDWDKNNVMLFVYRKKDDQGSKGFDLQRVNNTSRLWYGTCGDNWGDQLSGFVYGVAATNNWPWESGDNWSSRWGHATNNYAHTGTSQTNLPYGTYYMSSTGSDNLSVTTNAVPTYTATIKVKKSENGGSSYTTQSSGSWPATVMLKGTCWSGTAGKTNRSEIETSTGASGTYNTIPISGAVTLTLGTSQDAAYEFKGFGRGDTPSDNTNPKDYNITENTTYYAFFARKQFVATFNVHSSGNGSLGAKENGSTTISSGGKFNYGSSITFTATPNSGYAVEGWYSNASCTSKITAAGTSTTYTPTNLISAISVYVKFKTQEYNVTFGVGTGYTTLGSVTASVGGGAAITAGEYSIGASSRIVFTATPNTGYEVEGWYSDAACTGTKRQIGGNSYTIASLAKAETVYVKFKYTDYTINFVVDPAAGGRIIEPTLTSGQYKTAHYQVPFDIEAQANQGYTFIGWTSTSNIRLGVADASSATTPARKLANNVELQLSSDQPATTAALTNVNGDKTITAHFTETMHTVSVVANDDNKGTVSPASVSAGITTKSGEITATPKPGYYFKEWTLPDGVTLAQGYTQQDATIKINATADDITIIANFAPRFYLRGSIQGKLDSETGGMPGWDDEAKTTGLFSPINGTTATITRTLNAATKYKLKLGDMTGNSWGGSHEFKSGEDLWTFSSQDQNCEAPTFTTAIAGEYTFTIDFSEASPKMKITYPTPDFTLQVATTRVYEESTLTFIAGNGTEDNPYQFYLDEKMHLAITALPAVSGVTAYYKFGDDAESSTSLTKDITATETKQSVEVKAYYKGTTGSYVSAEQTETIWYQGVATPALHLTASWNEKEESELSANPEVTIYYSTDYYAGAATVTRSIDGADPTTFMTITTEEQKNQTYQMANRDPHRYDFKATATINNRTFIATTSVSIYRLVEVRVKDTQHLMTKYYMWINDSNPLQQEAAWPGNDFIGKLGDWHIFLVKYPSYTHFVLNDGKSTGAEQTVDVQLPAISTCYEIGEKDGTKYTVTEADDCPPILYVGNIANVTLHQGESQLITPDVDLDFGYNESQLQITFPDLPSGFTAVQQGKNFMLTGANQCGATQITVKYTLSDGVNSHEETRTFYATVTHPSNILIQVKVPTSINWNHSGLHDNVYINYWNSDSQPKDGTYIHMTFKTYDSSTESDNYYYSVPLDAHGKVCFRVGYPEGESWDANDRHTVYVNDVTKSGCYSIYPSVDTYGRPITRDGNDCWASYQVVINMANGKTYYSNKVENLNDIVSFYAPGKDETGNKSGLVRILRNGTQVATVPAATFNSSTVYTAKIAEGGTGLTNVEYYTGDFYIRTNGAEGGWNDYKKESHKFTYFTPYEGALYDYYWVMNKKVDKPGDKLNIKGCIGNEYNENLANMIEASNYTDGYGDITPDAGTGVNLRFGYNPETNYFERSILRGSTAGESNFLNIVGDNIYNDKSCTEELNEANYTDHAAWSKFGDISNWVYEKNIYVKIDGGHQSAQALLKSKAFNETIIYQLGYTRNPITGEETSTPAQRDILSIGTTNGTYNIRVIYDFKTNRIVSAWSPIEDVTYGDERRINADVLFVRHEEQPVAQVNLSNNNAKVSSLKSAYFVMEIDGATPQQKSGESIYWFSVPFDCYINSIFGVEGYVTLNASGLPTAGTWGIQEYDGKTRAEKGWYAETATFWRWMRKDEKLEKGHGYVLVFDRSDANNKGLWKEISREEPCKDGEEGCTDGKKTVTTTVLRLYFPSSESGWQMTRSGEGQSVTYDDWTCEKKNRKAQDSNWRLLGTDSYSDIMISAQDQFYRMDNDSVLDEAPNFVYEYHAEWEAYHRYKAVTSVDSPFQSFYCYMVQFSGTINWNQYTQSEQEAKSGVVARRIVAENELTNAQMTLSLKKGNNTEDNTYIYMDTRATTDFDNQMDLTKITDTRANQIYSVIEEVEYAGNTLPVEDQIVPLTVNVNANGAYTFAMPNMTDGLEVYLIDNTTGSHTDMAIDSYTVDLNKGKIADRFYLDVRVKERTTPTIIETIGADGNPTGDRFIKVIQNDQLHIIRNGRIYNASGMELTK